MAVYPVAMTSTRRGGNILSAFWTPLVAIGCSGPQGPNAQISVSVFGASVVPDQPRLLAVLYKRNYTHDLVAAKGDFSLSLLAESQVDLLPVLGFVSGRDRPKPRRSGLLADGAGQPRVRRQHRPG